jgi:glutamate-1-semialdehyde 2,1-aminomutase
MEDKWKKSREFLVRAEGSLAGGVSSPFRRKSPVPLFFRDGSGCRLEDVDGNRYIDYGLGWGPLILGHRHPALLETLRSQVERPFHYGAQHELESRLSERVQRLVPCAERVAFTSSGSEAVQLALRLSRAFTGRKLVVKFEGHYHGWMDSILASYHPPLEELGTIEQPLTAPGTRGQLLAALDDLLVCSWNRTDLVNGLFRQHGDRIAAVIMEPVLCNSGCLLPREDYLRSVQELCARHGALFIFDEVITGFRIALGGAQELYGITPDLCTLGKAIGGGLPFSAVAGRREILEQLMDGVAFGGTYNGNPLSVAAADTTLAELEKDGGEPLAHARAMGDKLIAGLRALAASRPFPVKITGLGTAFSVHFTEKDDLVDYRDTLGDDTDRLSRFVMEALKEGIYLLPDGRWYVSAVHGEEDIAETLEKMALVFQRLC